MEALSAEKLTHNAYRILGLGGDATQEAILAAARRMRLWANSGKFPASNWDFLWLGPLERSKAKIEQAVARLNEPSWRVEERLLWFCGAPEVLAEKDLSSVAQKLAGESGNEDAVLRQNRAVVQLAGAIFQPLPVDPKTWKGVLDTFCRLGGLVDQLRWHLELENKGGFEKRATEVEVGDSQRAIPQMIAAALDRHVEKALDDENVQDAAAFLEILRSAGAKSHQRILDRMEAMLEQRCRSAQGDLRAGIRFQPEAATANRAICISVREYFDNSIAPLRRDLMKLAGEEYERIRRIRWQCARTLSMLGWGWISALQFMMADETLNEAMGNAQGATQENEIREQMRENQARAARERQVYQRVQAGQPAQGGVYVLPHGGSGIVGVQAGPARRVAQPKPLRSGSKWAITAVVATLLRLALVNHTSSSGKPQPPPQYAPRSYNSSYDPTPPRKPTRSPTYPPNPRPGPYVPIHR